jgi:hypothetical protein
LYHDGIADGLVGSVQMMLSSVAAAAPAGFANRVAME